MRQKTGRKVDKQKNKHRQTDRQTGKKVGKQYLSVDLAHHASEGAVLLFNAP